MKLRHQFGEAQALRRRYFVARLRILRWFPKSIVMVAIGGCELRAAGCGPEAVLSALAVVDDRRFRIGILFIAARQQERFEQIVFYGAYCCLTDALVAAV